MGLISIGLILFTVACQNSSNHDSTQPTSPETLVGADRYEFGCIGSAGYIRSVLKDTCIRAFRMTFT